VRTNQLEVEVESTEKAFVEGKLKEYLSIPKNQPDQDTDKDDKSPGNRFSKEGSLNSFVKKINPVSKSETAAAIAYFLENHSQTVLLEWRPNDLADKFPDVRKSKPKNMTDTIRKSDLFMNGKTKGSYQLSEDGVEWVEGRLKGQN
jgi:hypothetical protein